MLATRSQLVVGHLFRSIGLSVQRLVQLGFGHFCFLRCVKNGIDHYFK